MGKKTKKIVRVVLDTNILISALLFKGELSRIVELWQMGKIIPLLSNETFEELQIALEYPKFNLSRAEIKSLIYNEILLFLKLQKSSNRSKEHAEILKLINSLPVPFPLMQIIL